MKVLVTGANGFIGKNLCVRLGEAEGIELIRFCRGDSESTLFEAVANADAIVHLAGENRPQEVASFEVGNTHLTQMLCQAIRATKRNIPLILASSAQAGLDNPYGVSKRKAEQCVEALASDTGNAVAVYRLPGVFGKWCKPNYNSVVATFCSHIANDLPIQINDPNRIISLVYIDDVMDEFLSALANMRAGASQRSVQTVYAVALGALAQQIQAFKNCRTSLVVEDVGKGLIRALYATYVSYLPTQKFAYDVPSHSDARGNFVEMLKTVGSGQFSYFTALPGVTRGGHYHHSKTEKFLVIKGVARFGFRHVLTNEVYELHTNGDKPQVVETVPGWTHDITNIGNDEMIVMLWANENFDRTRPDTIASKVYHEKT